MPGATDTCFGSRGRGPADTVERGQHDVATQRGDESPIDPSLLIPLRRGTAAASLTSAHLPTAGSPALLLVDVRRTSIDPVRARWEAPIAALS